MESSAAILTSAKDLRLEKARVWLQKLGVDLQSELHNIAGDASFRRYFRLRVNGESRILMDAPPPGEDVGPFIEIDQRLMVAGLHAPEIIYADRANGFLLLEDLGDELYRDLLRADNVDLLFPPLFDLLKTLALDVDCRDLPEFDYRKLRRDMDLFPDWYLGHHRKRTPRDQLDKIWGSFCDCIIESALHQPQAFVHRDFHSCNLLGIADNGIGIIDFQDAVKGPLSYDFTSLIWDRYISWPRSRIENWMETMRLELCPDLESAQWRRYCDLMGLQRNFKIVGIFARLH
ncbi:MAG TPA: phosphotransferase, partial [Xanthomonadales bacterium]